MKTGRPKKWDNSKKNISIKLAEQGRTDKEICQILEISESLFNLEKAKDKSFLESIRAAKESFDSEIVENALLRRAVGMTVKEKCVRTSNGQETVTITEKEIPPDGPSLALYLRNRNPEKWCREKQNLNVELEQASGLTREEALKIIKDDPFGQEPNNQIIEMPYLNIKAD